jgi:FG-GAP repeat
MTVQEAFQEAPTGAFGDWTRIQNSAFATRREDLAVDRFGAAVAISSDTALVGAPGASGTDGAVYVFVRTQGNWVLEPKGQAVPGSGVATIITDTTVASAKQGPNFYGSAYAFKHADGKWKQHVTLAPDHCQDNFGDAIALPDDRVLIGAPPNCNEGLATAAFAYVFDLQL